MDEDAVRVHLNRFEEWPPSRGCRDAAARAVRVTLAGGAPDAAGGPATGDAEVSVTCLSEREIREMNRRYLSRDGTTDVIAFDLGEDGTVLGDVYLCPEVARQNASERGVEPSREVLRLVIHGVLHVLGWEHPEGHGREESEMYRRQEAILDRVLAGTGRDHAGEEPRGGAPA